MNRMRTRSGFTLIELLVIVAIIALVLAIAMPSISTIISGSGPAQARNAIDGYLTAARGLAIRSRQYVALHIQPHHANADEFWMGILEYNPVEKRFHLMEGTELTRLPQGVGIGEVRDTFVSSPNPPDPDVWNEQVRDQRDDFTSLTLVFDPTGRLVQDVLGEKVRFAYRPDVHSGRAQSGSFSDLVDRGGNWIPGSLVGYTILFTSGDNAGLSRVITGNDLGSDPDDPAGRLTFRALPDAVHNGDEYRIYEPVFAGDYDPANNVFDRLWDIDVANNGDPDDGNPNDGAGEDGARAMCVFVLRDFDVQGDAAAAADYLNENARFLAVSPYTGGLLKTPAE